MEGNREQKMRTGQCRIRSERGQSLLEVAFLTPLLLALVIGVIEIGRYAYFAIQVGNAARAGAAYGSEGITQASCSTSPCGIQCAAYNDYYGETTCQNPNGLSVTVSQLCACDTGGALSNQTSACSTQANPGIGNTIAACSTSGGHWVGMIAVTASGQYHSLFSYPGIPTPITITRTATIRVADGG